MVVSINDPACPCHTLRGSLTRILQVFSVIWNENYFWFTDKSLTSFENHTEVVAELVNLIFHVTRPFSKSLPQQ